MALGNTPRRETNITVEASKSYVLGLHFIQQAGSDTPEPVDLTGCILRFVATDPPQRGSTEVLSLVAELTAPLEGLAQFKFQASDLTLETGSYAYDVTLLPPSGYSTPIIKGYIEIGSNADLDDSNIYTDLTITSDITVVMDQSDVVEVTIERVDGMVLIVENMIDEFTDAMEAEVAKAAASAQSAQNSENLAEGYAEEMRVWLNNAGFPFWKGTYADYQLLTPQAEVLYLFIDEAVS